MSECDPEGEDAIMDRLNTLTQAYDPFFNRFNLPTDHPLSGVSDWQLAAVVDFLLGVT